MPSYNLHGLDPRTFQQLAQALTICEFGPGVTVYGDGPDGGRDASFIGDLNYASEGTPWQGYTVIQAKFRQKPGGDPQGEGDWLRGQIEGELAKYSGTSPKYKRPDFYLLITSVELTPVPETGTDAKIRTWLSKHGKSVGLKGWDVWDGLKLQRLLDKHAEVARRYGGFVTAGDVLATMQALLEQLTPSFQTVMSDFLQSEVAGSDQFARLKEAGSASERKTALADVFVDLPASERASLEPPGEQLDDLGRVPPGFAHEVLAIGGLKLDNESILTRRTSRQTDHDAEPDAGRFVLIGGPGQGKSTLGQFICQVYRASILRDRPPSKLSWEARSATSAIVSRCEKDGIELPTTRRFPVRVELKNFADELAKSKCRSLLDYVARQIDKRSGQTVDRDDLDRWLGSYPWLLVLDGLDEVPTSSNRDEVMEQIQGFAVQCATRSADVLIIATSRPQGYGDAFQKRHFCHRYLLPLSNLRALHYGKGLTDACYGHDPQLKADIMERLAKAAERPTTSRLMRSPLQVTILTILAELRGELPHDRWQLFQEYYQTICNRETQRNLELSGTLREYDLEIAHIHQESGLRLQIANEVTGENDALLSRKDFAMTVSICLRDRFDTDQPEGAHVAAKLIDAALQRLVFLVSPQGEGIGFEIRSLQEFMAARALMEGSDREICDRLRAIAPYPYWRNVFLFAAGKCIRERRHLVENIIGICHTLNTGQEDPVLVATLAGSCLALDLLEDTTFRSLPKCARALAEIALKLLDLPLAPLHHRLGEVCRSQQNLGPIFSSELEKRLLVEIGPSSTSWNVLLSLVDNGPGWAATLADKNWPSDPPGQLELVSRGCGRAARWLSSRWSSVLNEAGPGFLHRHQRPLEDVAQHLPTWARAGLAIVMGAAEREAPLRLGPGRGTAVRLGFTSISQAAPHWTGISTLGDPRPGWLPFSAATRFLMEPTKESLARELQTLAEGIGEEDLRSWTNARLPWPLATCLDRVEKPTGLAALAGEVRAGKFGSTETWIAQEERWTTMGLGVEDLEAADPDAPGTFDAAWTGFPCWIHDEAAAADRHLDEVIAQVLQIYQAITNTRRRIFLARLIASSLSHRCYSSEDANGGKLPFCVSPVLLRDVVQIGGWHADLADVVLMLPVPEPLPDEWITFFDQVGEQGERVFGSPSFASSTIARAIARAYVDGPDRVGLLAWLEAACFGRQDAVVSQESLIPVRLLNFTSNDTPSVQRQKLVMRLARGRPAEAELPVLVGKAAEILTDPAGHDPWRIFRTLEMFRGEDWVGRFLTDLLAKLASVPRKRPGEPCIYSLVEWAESRRSPLHDTNCVRSLGLSSSLES